MVGDDVDNWDVLKGLTIDQFQDTLNVDNQTGREDTCKLLNLLVVIDEDNSLEQLSKESLRAKIKDLCPEEVVSVDPIESNLCTKKDGNGKKWYNFDYNGKLSPQVRNEFRDEILNKLGIIGGLFAPGEEKNCIENVKVWYEAPDLHLTSPAYTQYAAPKIDWWDGFKIECSCGRKTEETYMNKNLKITDLKHPYANPTKVIAPRDNSSNSSTTTPVKKKKPNGLEKVIVNDPVDVETSYDVDFL